MDDPNGSKTEIIEYVIDRMGRFSSGPATIANAQTKQQGALGLLMYFDFSG
ncbi:hypothetical protein NQT62_08635 [Limnobacter humi]|uniref:Uncharacterized protein n=1 Tax=Limnobacter humi TaxID=1778671 RepID=A0ABT1WHI2_9BURK|nr:hypothetical protein [Limnobacter humi]MCQ8896496.1 hypothetical protein [Limnobacter humi]